MGQSAPGNVPVMAATSEPPTAADRPPVPLLHVVICTYNRAHLLKHTLDSLARQDAPPDLWRVLVVDNNCTDNTRAVVEAFKDNIRDLTIVTEPRQGLTEARQRGFRATTAPWVAFVDDDCVLHESWVRHAIDFVQRVPDAAAFNGLNRVVYERGAGGPWVEDWMFAESNRRGVHVEQVHPGPLCGAGLVLRRDAVEKSGWLNAPAVPDRRGKSMVSGGDNELSVRARAGGGDLWFVPQCELEHSVAADRVSPTYLARLNFRLDEATPLLSLLQNDRSVASWRLQGLGRIGVRIFRVAGLAADPAVTAGGGWRSKMLAACRLAGFATGYAKLVWRSSGELRALHGLATVDGARRLSEDVIAG